MLASKIPLLQVPVTLEMDRPSSGRSGGIFCAGTRSRTLCTRMLLKLMLRTRDHFSTATGTGSLAWMPFFSRSMARNVRALFKVMLFPVMFSMKPPRPSPGS